MLSEQVRGAIERIRKHSFQTRCWGGVVRQHVDLADVEPVLTNLETLAKCADRDEAQLAEWKSKISAALGHVGGAMTINGVGPFIVSMTTAPATMTLSAVLERIADLERSNAGLAIERDQADAELRDVNRLYGDSQHDRIRLNKRIQELEAAPKEDRSKFSKELLDLHNGAEIRAEALLERNRKLEADRTRAVERNAFLVEEVSKLTSQVASLTQPAFHMGETFWIDGRRVQIESNDLSAFVYVKGLVARGMSKRMAVDINGKTFLPTTVHLGKDRRVTVVCASDADAGELRRLIDTGRTIDDRIASQSQVIDTLAKKANEEYVARCEAEEKIEELEKRLESADRLVKGNDWLTNNARLADESLRLLRRRVVDRLSDIHQQCRGRLPHSNLQMMVGSLIESVESFHVDTLSPDAAAESPSEAAGLVAMIDKQLLEIAELTGKNQGLKRAVDRLTRIAYGADTAAVEELSKLLGEEKTAREAAEKRAVRLGHENKQLKVWLENHRPLRFPYSSILGFDRSIIDAAPTFEEAYVNQRLPNQSERPVAVDPGAPEGDASVWRRYPLAEIRRPVTKTRNGWPDGPAAKAERRVVVANEPLGNKTYSNLFIATQEETGAEKETQADRQLEAGIADLAIAAKKQYGMSIAEAYGMIHLKAAKIAKMTETTAADEAVSGEIGAGEAMPEDATMEPVIDARVAQAMDWAAQNVIATGELKIGSTDTVRLEIPRNARITIEVPDRA